MRVVELGACQARKFGAAVVGNVMGVSKMAMWWPHREAQSRTRQLLSHTYPLSPQESTACTAYSIRP